MMNLIKVMRTFFLVAVFSVIGFFSPTSVFAAQTWHAYAGSGIGKGLVAVIKYYPQTITIDEGDTVTWTVAGDAHTISFLSGSPAPDPFSPQAQLPSGGNTYNGTGFVNSGIVNPGNTYTLTFTKAGTYTYNCLIHPGMSATVIVQPAGTAYPHMQNFYTQNFVFQKTDDISQGVSLLNSTTPPHSVQNSDGSTTHFIIAGVGNGTEAVFRFFPQVSIIQEGDSLTWTNNDLMMPHTVSLPGSDGIIPESFAPAGTSIFDGSIFTSSGVLFHNQTYTLKFTKAGKYTFVCLFHDELGMKGTIIVLRKL